MLASFASTAHAQPAKKPPSAPATPPSLADILPEGERLEYQAGRILAQDGDFAIALQKFLAVYERTREPRLLWNVAACEKNMRRYTRAITTLRKYLQEGSGKLTPSETKEAEEQIRSLEPLTRAVTFNVTEPGVELSVDDEIVGVTPLPRPVTLDLGSRRLRARKAGFRVIEKEVVIDNLAAPIDLVLERQRGALELKVPANAQVLLDDHPIGDGPVVVARDLPIGGHTLRVTAPRMLPYQGEVVLEDGKTRTVEIELVADQEQVGEIRVAVGCASQEVRTPEEGLTVFFDDEQDSASPLGVRRRLVNGAEIPAYVPFNVSPGRHRVRVRVPGCDELETFALARPRAPTPVVGMLPPSGPWLNGSPAGSPDGYRLAVGVHTSWLGFGDFQQFFDNRLVRLAESYVTMAGPQLTGGVQWRWFTLLADAQYIGGSTSGTSEGVTYAGAQTRVGPVSNAATFSATTLGLRLGPRIPIHAVSVSFGIGGSTGSFSATPGDGLGTSRSGAMARASGWAGVDAQPLCDFGAQVGFAYSRTFIALDGISPEPQQEPAMFFNLAYEPNAICRRKRSGQYRIAGEQ